MPKARKKKANDPFQEIHNAINGKMHRQHTAHMFICRHDLDRLWADHPLRTIFPSFSQDECDSTRQRYICVLSILVYAKWADLKSRFRPLFLREDGRDDTHLPFKDLDFLGDFALAFSSYQQAFKPAIIEERNERYIQSIPPECRLPFIGEPEPLGKGGYGSVTKRVIAPRCLWNKRDNKENKEPTLVACKIYRNENPSQDFRREVGNLDYIKEGLTDSKRVMKHIAAIVHGAEFMIILPHANLHNLEFFLRGGYKPHPGTDKPKKIYDFDVEFCTLDTPVKLQRALVEEAHQLASALKWLHEDLTLFGSSNRYLAHMDLKPANVLLVGDPESPAGKWMLSDFGVSSFDKATNARVWDTPSIHDVGLSFTSRGFQDRISRGHGTFQPPEVELENVDSRKCDLWSFGCVLCDILAFAIGKTEAVSSFRNLRCDAGDDYFYRTTTPAETRITEIDDSNTELKTQIVQWWKSLEDDFSCPTWVTDYVKILREALRPKPSDRSRITDIVNGLNELAPSINSQESGGLASEPKISSSRPQPNGSALQHTLEAHEKRPSITVSSELSPPHCETMYPQDAATEGKDHSLPSARFLSPGLPLPRQPSLDAGHKKDISQSSPSIESQNDSATHDLDTPERRALSPPDEPSAKERTASINKVVFRERFKISISLPKRKNVKAVAIAPSALQVALLCKHSVHLYSTKDGEETRGHIDLSPEVDWKKVRLASHYLAVYGLGLSNEKHIEIFDSETMSSEATITNNDELAQDVLLSDKEVFAYVYGKKVKLHFARHTQDWVVPNDDALIIEAKFSPNGQILCVWATGTRADHAYFVEIKKDSASLCGKGSYLKTNTNPHTYEIWPFLDSPACVIHEAYGGTFLAQPLVQSEPQPRNSIGISNALTACVIREDLLLCLRSRTFRSERLLCGFTLSQESRGHRRIADQCRDLCAANKGIEKSTASAVHLVDGKFELVLCTITGKVLRYVQS